MLTGYFQAKPKPNEALLVQGNFQKQLLVSFFGGWGSTPPPVRKAPLPLTAVVFNTLWSQGGGKISKSDLHKSD